MELKVVKFGGSSLADAEQFRKVANIIRSDDARRYVIPSAPGKRFDGDEKVTDLLYALYRAYHGEGDIASAFCKVTTRFDEIMSDLGLNLSLECEYLKIQKDLDNGAGSDYAASRGEYLNGIILSAYLGFTFIDAASCIFFRADGQLDAEKTNNYLKGLLKAYPRAVIPGFYGVMPDGNVTTFSRGGSDITGSIVARASAATLYENWTDVSGFLMADPRCVDHPRRIELITYKELRELSYMGATVLHDEAVFPVRYVGIPINIKNTNRPEDPGTFIVPGAEDVIPDTIITGIAGKTGFVAVTIEKDRMNLELGFGRKVFEVFEKYGLCIEHLPSSIDSISVIVNANQFKPLRASIIADIYRATDPDSLVIDEHIALIAVVGRGMVRNKGIAARIFRALADSNINIKMIDQGSSELNIIVGVEEKDFHMALRAIYTEFVQ